MEFTEIYTFINTLIATIVIGVFLWESMGLFISGGTKNTTDIMWGCIGGQKMTVMFAHRLG
jgi:hypothetical protein